MVYRRGRDDHGRGSSGASSLIAGKTASPKQRAEMCGCGGSGCATLTDRNSSPVSVRNLRLLAFRSASADADTVLAPPLRLVPPAELPRRAEWQTRMRCSSVSAAFGVGPHRLISVANASNSCGQSKVNGMLPPSWNGSP